MERTPPPRRPSPEIGTEGAPSPFVPVFAVIAAVVVPAYLALMWVRAFGPLN